MNMENGLELPRKGLIKQELISYEVDEFTNMLTKKIHTRKYAEDGIDYIDTWNNEPLYSASAVASLSDKKVLLEKKEKNVPWHPMGNT